MGQELSRKDLFSINFYKWAHQQLQEEVENDYPLIRQVLSVHVERFLRVVGALDSSDQKSLASGLTKRFHEFAAQNCGDPITAHEQKLLQQFLDADIRFPQRRLKWSRSEMRDVLAPVLKTVYSMDKCEWEMGECDFRAQIGDWQIHTFLDTHRFNAKFTYFHSLHYRGEEMEPMTAVLNWNGICGGGSSWDAAETPSQAIPGFTLASQRLLKALPFLSPK